MTKYQKSVNKNKKKQEERVPTPFCWLDIGKSQKLVNKKKEEENKPAPEPFSNLDAFKELIAIENRVSNVRKYSHNILRTYIHTYIYIYIYIYA